MICVKIIMHLSASIQLVALDNFYKLNCFLLIFSSYHFYYVVVLLLYSYFR